MRRVNGMLHYVVHGVPITTDFPIRDWPSAKHGAPAIAGDEQWLITLDNTGEALAAGGLPTMDPPHISWNEEDPSVAVLTMRGETDGTASAVRFTTRWNDRWIHVEFTHGHDTDQVADLLSRWFVPQIARLHGALPLHAAALTNGTDAILICGESGAGKSSTSAALTMNGWRLLSDEPVLIWPAASRDGAPALWPGRTTLSVDRPTLQALGHPRAESAPEDRFGKCTLRSDACRGDNSLKRPPGPAVTPTQIWYLTGRQPVTAPPKVTPLDPTAATEVLMAQRHAGASYARNVRLDFPRAGLVASRIPVLAVSLPHDLRTLGSTAAALAIAPE
ncbi:MAG: hypothetical protein ACH36H_02025 [Candidatus Nanopelagicales bacterium]